MYTYGFAVLNIIKVCVGKKMVLARSIYRAGSHSMYQRILAVFLQEIVNVDLYYLKQCNIILQRQIIS